MRRWALELLESSSLHQLISVFFQVNSLEDPAKTQLVTGGLGGLGLQTAHALTARPFFPVNPPDPPTVSLSKLAMQSADTKCASTYPLSLHTFPSKAKSPQRGSIGKLGFGRTSGLEASFWSRGGVLWPQAGGC